MSSIEKKALGQTTRLYIVEGGRVQILKARRVTELAGMLRRGGQLRVTLAEMDTAAAQGAAHHDRAGYKRIGEKSGPG